MVLWGYELCRRDIPNYFTEQAMAAIELWQRYRQFGLPFAGGWAEQPAVFMDVIQLFEAELAKRKAKSGDKR